jgi:hypothetical protein
MRRIQTLNPVGSCTATQKGRSSHLSLCAPYKADVEFLSKGSWKKELDVLLADIRDNLNDTKLKKPAAGTHAQPPGLQVRSKEAQRSWDTVCFVFCLSFKMTTTALSHLDPSSISRSYPRTIGRHH